MPVPECTQTFPSDPVLQALAQIVEKLGAIERCLWHMDAAMAGMARDMATMATDMAIVRHMRD